MSQPQGQVGPYSLLRLLATGSQSQVWHAQGPQGDVALKVARTARHREALALEAYALQLGQHPGLPAMLDYDADFNWIAIEPIQGSQIDQWAQVQEIPEVVRATNELLDVLEFLHKHGVAHGDVKPSNVLVDVNGRVKLLDLGVASIPGKTEPGFRGTLGYAAPELLRGEPSQIPQSDLYGLGALLYTCITGRPPFVAADPAALTYLPMVSLPAPPSALNPNIPAALEDLLLDLLARDPKRRPQTIDDVRRVLHRVAVSDPPQPLLGMLEERDVLRRAVVGATEKEPRVVVIYGPPGSGRRNLIGEAVNCAKREGLRYHKGGDIRTLLEAVKSSDRPVVAVLRGTSKNAQKLALLILRDALPCLLLLHADRPVPILAAKGAIEVTPSPLSTLDITRLARAYGADTSKAEQWWRDSLGLPIAALGRIRAWRRIYAGDPLSLDHLPGEPRKVMRALKGAGAVLVPDLAKQVGLTENQLLDHCEVLFAEELVVADDDGESIRRAEGI